MNNDQVILDDGEFYIVLNCNYKPDEAPGVLNHRCAHGLTTPGGYECVGGFDRALDGTWHADVNAPYDAEMDSDCRRVIKGVSRMDAIIALWHARHSAHVGHLI